MQLEQPEPFAVFEFNLKAAVLSQVTTAFEALPICPLTKEFITKIVPERGVFQLFESGTLVCISVAPLDIPSILEVWLFSLETHYREQLAEYGYKCLVVGRDSFGYLDESILVSYYQGMGLCDWND
jgi:hypothetical protein